MFSESAVILGSVDRFEGAYLTGWAIAVPGESSCTIEVTDGSGHVVGSGRAARTRSDLSTLGYGHSNFAFRIPIPELGASETLCVRANAEELPGSPIMVGAGLHDGFAEIINGTVLGWVTERRAGFHAPKIRLVDQNDADVAWTRAVIDRSGNDPLYTPARYRIALPSSCYGLPELQLRVLADGAEFARVGCALRLVGFTDGVLPDRCAGWLLSPDAPKQRFDIEVLRNGHVVGAGACNLPRTDLREMHPLSWDVGFDIALDEPDREVMRTSELSLRIAGTGVELFGGPFVVGRRPAIVAAGRRAARLAHDDTVRLDDAERSVLQAALAEFTESRRRGSDYAVLKQARPTHRGDAVRRLSVIIPIYRDVAVTRACIDSVLRQRNPEADAVILLNDCSPDAGMADMLEPFAQVPNVFLLSNPQNCGFVQSVNRALGFCRSGDVVLLNSDTLIFDGGLDELWRAANSANDIGTATALSNNATIFSYPHPLQAACVLDDASWSELAAVALREQAGRTVDVPTGHGFCMLIRRAILDRQPRLNEKFGRGYGEENELCLRAADLGYRHVAAIGAFVEHRESVSFGGDKDDLLKLNLPQLEAMFPEYTPTIMEFQKSDELRRARWALDAYRLRKAADAGVRFALMVENWLGGGTARAARDIEAAVGYGAARKLRLCCNEDGTIELQASEPRLQASFLAEETGPLFDLLEAAGVELVVIHQLLGFGAAFIEALGPYATGRRCVYFVHDFYALCPRVNMIDAIGQFCEGADAERCARCVALGGSHEGSRLGELAPAEHRALFARALGSMEHLIAPSGDCARQIARVFPELQATCVPHPQPQAAFPQHARDGSFDDVVLLGAIGPHKGSAKLLELAQRARLHRPTLRLHVIGYTDIDRQLKAVGNVMISGRYEAAELPRLLAASRAKLALFLHNWPETFSFTLTEAVMHGLIPLVPDIGAPAERVRAAGFGVVFPFPIDSLHILEAINGLASGRLASAAGSGSPAAFSQPCSASQIARFFGIAETASQPTRAIGAPTRISDRNSIELAGLGHESGIVISEPA